MDIVWKISNLKIKMSLLGSKSSSNILIKNRCRRGKKQTQLKIREQHTPDNRHPINIFVPRHLSKCTKQIFRDNLPSFFQQPPQQQRNLLRFVKLRFLVNSIWGQEEEIQHFDDNEPSKELKDKIFLIFQNFRKLCLVVA